MRARGLWGGCAQTKENTGPRPRNDESELSRAGMRRRSAGWGACGVAVASACSASDQRSLHRVRPDGCCGPISGRSGHWHPRAERQAAPADKDKARRGPRRGPPGSSDRFHGSTVVTLPTDGPVAGVSMNDGLGYTGPIVFLGRAQRLGDVRNRTSREPLAITILVSCIPTSEPLILPGCRACFRVMRKSNPCHAPAWRKEESRPIIIGECNVHFPAFHPAPNLAAVS
jgi:hypothetical protein